MNTLTDRYVWGVLRAVPEAQRPDLEPEIRALVADAVEAKVATGTPERDAERAALVELGDPGLLAARYTDRTQYLIGPRLFGEWRRLLTILLPIVPTIVGIVALGAALIEGSTAGQAIVAGLGAAFMVAVQMTFWVTLVFALIERTDAAATAIKAWTPDDLPDAPATERLSAGELVGSVITSLIVAGLIVWQQLQAPIVIDGTGETLFDPALWSFWLPWFLALAVIQIVFAIALYVRGRWTLGFALVNAVLEAAFAIPAIYLLQNGLLLNPIVADEIAAAGGTWLSVTVTITSVVIAAVAAWDAIDGFRKAYVNRRRTPVLAA